MNFNESPTELTTAATDFILAVLAFGIVFYLLRLRSEHNWKANVWATTFGMLGLAGIFGALAHGVAMAPATNRLLWQPLNLALGLTISLFVVGAVYDRFGLRTARRALPVMLGIGVAFFAVTQIVTGTFLVFVIYEAAAMLTALVIYAQLAARRQLPGAAFMTVGVLLTIIAAGVQASKIIAFTFIWQFDHNGAFHLIQMVGLVMLLIGLRAGLLASSSGHPRTQASS